MLEPEDLYLPLDLTGETAPSFLSLLLPDFLPPFLHKFYFGTEGVQVYLRGPCVPVCVCVCFGWLSRLTVRIYCIFFLERLPSERGSTDVSQHVGVWRKIQPLRVNLCVRRHMCFCACDSVAANVDTPFEGCHL